MDSTSFEESVKQRAFELFLERGGMHGNDQQDWFKAEMEMRSKNGNLTSEIRSSGKSDRKRRY